MSTRELRAIVVGLIAGLSSGCGESFVTEEMDLDSANKVRPIAIVFEPAEASPGEVVEVTLLWHDPDPSRTVVSWRAALEYDAGLYEVNPIERHVIDVEDVTTVPEPVNDGLGFLTQTFTFTIPDSTLIWSPSLENLVEDAELGDVAERMFPGTPSAEITAAAVDGALSAVSLGDLVDMDDETRSLVREVADLFACQIRFRATLENGVRVDVTRSLTVRHSRRLSSSNENRNPEITDWWVAGVPREDADWSDLSEFEDEIERFAFVTGGAVPEVRLPRRAGWTYYLVIEEEPQSYRSPFSGGVFEELSQHRWYWFGQDDAAQRFALFRDEAGDETDMDGLGDAVRLAQPAGGDVVRFRTVTVVRDERPEWQRYQAAPGLSLRQGDVVFE